PNLLMAKEPEFGITTHPEVVRALIRILKNINSQIFIGDGPSVWGAQIENVGEVYRRTGMEALCAQEHVQLVTFDKKRWRGSFPLTTWLDECDCFISIPKFKTHEFTLMTGAVKNLFGLVSGTFKTELHKRFFKIEDFASVLADIYEQAKPALTVVDGIIAMEGDGPGTSGKPYHAGVLLAGNDCVALDSVMASLMGIKPHQVASTRIAAQRGLGCAELKTISIMGDRPDTVFKRPFVLPKNASLVNKLPSFLVAFVATLIKYVPLIKHDQCQKCMACIKVCPQHCISMHHDKVTIEYKNCIACFCCQESCPASAITVKKSLLARLMGL
ncbi:MAG: DUF362 domain-containing protein, partial [Candidatus Omnitrophica bacterium]|nr:DUF362 domain-containing protein [Candidatus Omnitrophota bacterium]